MTSHSYLLRGLLAGVIAASLFILSSPAMAQDTPAALMPADQPAPLLPAPLARRADFMQEASSTDVRELAHWVVDSADNRNLPFMVIDKVQARVFAFDAQGRLRGATSALLGTAVGDDSVPGIGQRKLSTIRPHERTTAAGRFMAYLDLDIKGEEVLWVDYETSLSLHRIVTTQLKDRRAERLASPSPADNRITFGCINVSVAFYERIVSPLFKGTQGVVYILPETRPLKAVFNSYAVEEQLMQAAASAPAAQPSPR